MTIRLVQVPISPQTIIDEMTAKRVLYKGHFRLKSGDCTDTFVVARRAQELYALRRQLVNVLLNINFDSDKMLHLSMNRDASTIIRAVHDMFRITPKQFLYADGTQTGMALSPKQVKVLKQRPFVVIDDVVRKGVALTGLIGLCKEHDLKPVSIIAAINSGLSEISGTPIVSLVKHPMRQWKHGTPCKLCQEDKIRIVDPYFFDR